MARLVYIDETGSPGKGGKDQPLLTLVAVLVDEDKVQPLAKAFQQVAEDSLRPIPDKFEFHGSEIWGRRGAWKSKALAECNAVYEDAISVLESLDIDIAHASIHKQRLHDRYNGIADENAYLLALQFLLEKIDAYSSRKKILIADEAKEQELHAIRMVADMQEWGGGLVPGTQLRTVIDSMHFVRSHTSPGVQLADLVAFALQRKRSAKDKNPGAVAVLNRITEVIWAHTRTWRAEWPAAS